LLNPSASKSNSVQQKNQEIKNKYIKERNKLNPTSITANSSTKSIYIYIYIYKVQKL